MKCLQLCQINSNLCIDSIGKTYNILITLTTLKERLSLRRGHRRHVPKDSAIRYLRSFIHKHTLNIILLHYA